jgi:hypothetical protein
MVFSLWFTTAQVTWREVRGKNSIYESQHQKKNNNFIELLYIKMKLIIFCKCFHRIWASVCISARIIFYYIHSRKTCISNCCIYSLHEIFHRLNLTAVTTYHGRNADRCWHTQQPLYVSSAGGWGATVPALCVHCTCAPANERDFGFTTSRTVSTPISLSVTFTFADQ